MNIVILNTNSFGGNYEYSRCLAGAYTSNKKIENCFVLIPENAFQTANSIYKKILISDLAPFKNKFFKKIYFLFRSVVNPVRTYLYLRKIPSSIVIFNDFEQISSFIWVPLFKTLKAKHRFIVILHDPDRDNYLPVKALSIYSMSRVMSIMDIALYHEVLPDKPYYKLKIPKIKVPHGIYFHDNYDASCMNSILDKKGEDLLLGILGNIREEKNYNVVIEALKYLKKTKLLIAGNASNSVISIEKYKKQISFFGLEERVIWLEKFMTDNELQAAIKSCDIILLYYKESFTSQSGILNLIAPHKKKIIVSDVSSALRETVKIFGLGAIAPLSLPALVEALKEISQEDNNNQKAWENYMNYANWNNHANIVIEAIFKYLSIA